MNAQMWTLLVSLGCTPPDPPPPGTTDTPPSATPDTAVDPERDSGTSTPTSTADTAAPPPAIDCTALPERGTPVAAFDDVPGFEDFTFSADGYLWGVSTETYGLYRIAYGAAPELLRPAVSTYARGTRFLPDGTLVSVDFPYNRLVAIDPVTYAVSIVAGGLTSPNGVAIGESGTIYVTQATGQVRTIDPATGATSVLVESPVSNDGITFSPDHRTLYLDSDQDGSFMAVTLDDSGAVVDPLTAVAELPGPSDGMTMDACGNAYVVQINSQTLERVHPDGTHETFLDLPNGSFVVAANFGSGTGGWARDHLFLADLFHGLTEVDAGVEGKWEPHYPR